MRVMPPPYAREPTLVFGRMQSARAGAELQIGSPLDALGAVPHTSAAEHAFLTIEIGRPFHASGDRLSGTHLHAQLGPAAAAHLKVAEANVVGVSRGSLDLTAHQQHVLMRYQQRAIVSDRGPSARVHQGIMERRAADVALMLDTFDLPRLELASIKLLRRHDSFARIGRMAA